MKRKRRGKGKEQQPRDVFKTSTHNGALNEVWEIYQGAIRWKHPFKIQTHILCFKHFKSKLFVLYCLW